MVEHDIIFQKEKDGSPIKCLVSDFKMVCLSFPAHPPLEAKDVAIDDWPDENGEDSFEPDILPLKAYNLEVQIGYYGESGTANTKVLDFIKYLLGHDNYGAKLKMYNPHTGMGFKGVRFVSYTPEQYQYLSDDLMVFTITFRVTDPVNSTSPIYTNDIITGLS